MWWWWRVCWGWCCCLSCRVKGTVSCCNTERTAPDRMPDNCDSPVVRHRWNIGGQKRKKCFESANLDLKIKGKRQVVTENKQGLISYTNVATLQSRFRNINANTCVFCPTSGQCSALLLFSPFPLCHNIFVLQKIQ